APVVVPHVADDEGRLQSLQRDHDGLRTFDGPRAKPNLQGRASARSGLVHGGASEKRRGQDQQQASHHSGIDPAYAASRVNENAPRFRGLDAAAPSAARSEVRVGFGGTASNDTDQ